MSTLPASLLIVAGVVLYVVAIVFVLALGRAAGKTPPIERQDDDHRRI